MHGHARHEELSAGHAVQEAAAQGEQVSVHGAPSRGANPDAGRPVPGPFWDVNALKNPPPGLNSSLKKHTSNPKIQLKCKAGILNSS